MRRRCCGLLRQRVPSASRRKRGREAASVRLRIELYDIEPSIWRRIVVHSHLQWVMGWQTLNRV
jgi:hypothetical protein